MLFFEDERPYWLGRGDVAAVVCGEVRNRQLSQVILRATAALEATVNLELQGDQLFLTGPEVRIVLVIDPAQ